jgi:hypothetical protein
MSHRDGIRKAAKIMGWPHDLLLAVHGRCEPGDLYFRLCQLISVKEEVEEVHSNSSTVPFPKVSAFFSAET